MKYRFLFIISLLSHAFIHSQNSKYLNSEYDVEHLKMIGDSLVNQKKYTDAISIYKHNLNIRLDEKKNNESAIIFNKIGIIHYKQKDYIKAEKYYKKSLKFDKSSLTAGNSNYNLFLLKRKQSQQDSALTYLEKSLKFYTKYSGEYSSNNAFLTAGITYKNRQLYDKALKYLVLSYKGFNNLKNDTKLANVCLTIGNVHNQLKNYNQALEYHYEALELHKKKNKPKNLARCYNNLANVYDNLHTIDSAIINYNKAINYLKIDTHQYSKALSNIANTYLKINDNKKAKDYYKKAIKTNIKIRDTTSLLYNYNGIASLELNKNKLESSKKYLDIISGLVKKSNDNIILLTYYENLVNYNQKKKKYKDALDFQIKYSDLYKLIYNKEQTEIVQNIQSKFEYEKKENEILKLNLSNQNKQIELINKDKAIGKKNIILLILSFLFFFSLVVFYAYLQKQKLKSQNSKLDKLQAIYNGQENIKKRIARDLHDIITTNFDGLRLKILALKKTPKPDQLIEETTSELKNINRQIRIVSHRLSPLEMQMSHQKFTEVIKSRLSEFHLYGRVFVELEDQLPEALNQMNISIQNNFYGILLEILNNIEKHSHATKLNISHFIDNRNHLHFIFTDNGIGIAENIKEGIGMLNIRQRCEIINGEVDIKKIESGTEVSLSFPIKK